MKEDEIINRLLTLPKKLIDQGKEVNIPHIRLPSRTRGNIIFDENFRVWVYGNKLTTRSAKKKDEALGILKTLYVVDFFKNQVEIGKSSTLRELYYISENWGKLVRFNEQQESDKLIEDLEIILHLQREDFRMHPEEDGASILGNLRIREPTNRGIRDIHCLDDVGETGYSIPTNVDKLEFLDYDADFVIAVETGGMFMRLREEKFDEKFRSILVHLKGQPARATRRFLRRLNTELGLPVVVFTDCDPWSFRIYASVAYGAIKTAHLSEYIATPNAMFLGVKPSDIVEYDLPTDRLKEQDINALEAELEDPRFQSEFWEREIKLQLELGKKSEQQALAKYGLAYVVEEYLPNELAKIGII